MNATQPVQQEPIVIQDENENKLSESSTADTSTETVSTDANTIISSESPADTVSTDIDSSEYKEDFQSAEQSMPSETESSESQTQEVVDVEEPVLAPATVPAPIESPPLRVDLPVKTDNIKTVSKTQKQYDIIINKANNLRKQFTKKRKNMSTWDDNNKHEWRNKISDTLIAVIRQAKNKHTLKHHHVKLRSMRNLFNHYLNTFSSSKQSKKSRIEKKSKK
jgi:hypothetical protein